MIMTDYKTTDYCAQCNESPESGTHLLGPNRHDYVPPLINDVCRCGRARGAGVHAQGALNGHAWEPYTPAPENRLPTMLGVMRVKVETRPGFPQFGVLLGMLLSENGGDMVAVVRLDNYGLMLRAVHPSQVVPVTPDEEEAHTVQQTTGVKWSEFDPGADGGKYKGGL